MSIPKLPEDTFCPHLEDSVLYGIMMSHEALLGSLSLFFVFGLGWLVYYQTTEKKGRR